MNARPITLREREKLVRKFQDEYVFVRIVLFEKHIPKKVWDEPGMSWIRKYCESHL